MLADLINPSKIRRFLLWALYLVLTLVLQNTVFSRITVFGTKAMFLPAACVAMGMFEGGVNGAVFGLCMGFFADMSFAENTVLFTATFAVIGFLSGFLAEFCLNRRFYAYMVASFAALLLTVIIQMAGPLLVSETNVMQIFSTAGMQVLLSLPVAAIFFAPAKRIAERRVDAYPRKDRS